MDDNVSTMRQIKINRIKLIEVIQTNKYQHKKTFINAQSGYRKEVILELDKMLQDARNNNKIKRSVTWPEPKDHTEDYNQAIRMLEMCVSEVIEISHEDFKQLVMDEWGWKRSFTDTTSNYVQ